VSFETAISKLNSGKYMVLGKRWESWKGKKLEWFQKYRSFHTCLELNMRDRAQIRREVLRGRYQESEMENLTSSILNNCASYAGEK
jgi:hypothetical protein